MIKIILIMLFAGIILSGCAAENISENISDNNNETTISVTDTTTAETSPEPQYSVTFPKKETETETETTPAETQPGLKENQVIYSDKQKRILFEFIGTEHLETYQDTIRYSVYDFRDRVVHAHIELTNISNKEFTFIPGNLGLSGRKNNSRYSMSVFEDDYGETAFHERYYIVGAGETVSFDVDFIGDGECAECAESIGYKDIDYIISADGEHIDLPDDLPAFVKKFSVNDRYSVRDAVKTVLGAERERIENITLPEPRENEYTARTGRNYYCVSAEYSGNKNYIILRMRVQHITSEPFLFAAHDFYLENSDGLSERVHYWDIDDSLIYGNDEKEYYDLFGLELYAGVPFDIPVGRDGYAEYTLVFRDDKNENKGSYIFKYEADDLEIPLYIYD